MSAKTLPRVASLFACLLLVVKPAASQPKTSGPDVGYPLEFKFSPPAHSMPPQAHGGPKHEAPLHHPPARPRSGKVNDPVLQTSTVVPTVAQSLSQWEGLGAGYPG